jgi:hypothetical protein
MRAYRHIRFIEGPDIGDIQSQGRKSSVGRIPRGSTLTRFVDGVVTFADGTPGRRIVKICHNDHGYSSPASKAATRRYLKHVDRAIKNRYETLAEKD